jgi:hypothetical protein
LKVVSPNTRFVLNGFIQSRSAAIQQLNARTTTIDPLGLVAVESTLGNDGCRGEHLGSISYNSSINKWFFNRYPAKNLTGQFECVILRRNPNIMILSKRGHDSIGQGEAVLFAGTATFNHGNLQFWDNSSGHYKLPAGLALAQSIFPPEKFKPYEVTASIEEKANIAQITAHEEETARIRTTLMGCFSRSPINKIALQQVSDQFPGIPKKRIQDLAMEMHLIPSSFREKKDILKKYNELLQKNPKATLEELSRGLTALFPGHDDQFFIRLINDQ